MAQVAKKKLSGSTDGRGVLVVATATPGTLIHTAVTGTTAGTWDEIWLYAANTSTTDLVLTIEFGGTGVGDDFYVTIPGRSGRVLVVDGGILQNGTVVRAFAASGSTIGISGFVNAITA